MPTPAAEIAKLERMLAGRGADVTITRANVTPFSVKAKVEGVRVEQMRAGSSSSQAVSRAIVSPTGFPSGFLPVRATDKLTWNGSQRTILIATPIIVGATTIRIEVDFQG